MRTRMLLERDHLLSRAETRVANGSETDHVASVCSPTHVSFQAPPLSSLLDPKAHQDHVGEDQVDSGAVPPLRA